MFPRVFSPTSSVLNISRKQNGTNRLSLLITISEANKKKTVLYQIQKRVSERIKLPLHIELLEGKSFLMFLKLRT